jgi:hypothetical protein
VFASAGLDGPTDLAFDRWGNLFVTNVGDSTVRKFTPTGHPLGVTVSLLGAGCPGGLAFDPAGDLLVTDPCSDLVRRFAPGGGPMAAFAASGLRGPHSVAFDAAGDLYVGNTGDGNSFGHSVHRYSATGQDRGTFVPLGPGFPGGLAFDRAGDLLVADQSQRPGQVDYAIRRFSATGQELGALAVLPFQPRGLLMIRPTTPFSLFSAHLEITEGPNRPAGFEARAAFTLGPGSDGIDPLDEAVTLGSGAQFVTIPPGSFRPGRHGQFAFDGVIDGIILSARITPQSEGFTMEVSGRNVELDEIQGPRPLALTIGDDGGVVNAEVH